MRCPAITFCGKPGRFYIRCILTAGHKRSHKDDPKESLTK